VTGKLSVTVVDHDDHRSKTTEFTRGPVRVGRDPENEIHLPQRFVSSWHAVIRFDERAAVVEDLGTVNGFQVDGVRVPAGKRVEVRGRLALRIGALELIVEHTAGEARAAPLARSVKAPKEPRAPREPKEPRAPGKPLKSVPKPLSEDEQAARERAFVQGAIDSDEPPALTGGHTMAMNLGRAHTAVLRLRPIHERLTALQAEWAAAHGEAVRELKAARDETGLALLRREFATRGPESGGKADHGPAMLEDVDPEFFRQAELGAVAQAAEELVHGLRTPADIEETRRFLARVIDVLRTFAVGAVEQLTAADRQDAELGVKVDRDQNPLLTVDSPDELLRLLLDWRSGRADRTHQLVEALAAALTRPAALLRGALEVGRKVGEQLAPREIERSVNVGWPSRAGALWRRYEERYEAVFGDGEDGFARALRVQAARAVHDALARLGVPLLAREEEEEEP
jgi:pSer/pThr/pTyr-binding forkhead associated (FHA) protein